MRKAVTAALVLLATAAHGAPRSAEAVLAASKAATGGAAWDKAQGCHEEGMHGGGAIHYTTSFRLDGYGMRIDSERGGQTRSTGFNGAVQWQTRDGKTTVTTDPAPLSEALLTFYVSSNAFYFPDRFPAEFRYLREASEAGRAYDIVEITPKGSRAIELWFDRDTHLIRRVADVHGTPPTRVDADEYRQVGGFMIATRLTVHGPDGPVADDGAVASFSCGPIDISIFDPPKAR